MTETKKFEGITSFTLYLLAMIFMLCDHMWATIVPGSNWLTWIGRLAFPIFAFMIAEGYYYTSNVKKYTKRMLLFALVSEIPFNLMYGNSLIYPFHQNVMWTFLIALLCMRGIDKVHAKGKLWLTVPAAALFILLSYLICTLAMMDYYGEGFLMVLLFHFLRGRAWWQMAGQAIGMYYINGVMIKGLSVPIMLFGFELYFSQQTFAVLALIPIWLYKGKQGPHSKPIQYMRYAFYPVHMLILALIYMGL